MVTEPFLQYSRYLFMRRENSNYARLQLLVSKMAPTTNTSRLVNVYGTPRDELQMPQNHSRSLPESCRWLCNSNLLITLMHWTLIWDQPKTSTASKSLENIKKIMDVDSLKWKHAAKHYARMTMRDYARAVEFLFFDARCVRECSWPTFRRSWQ